MLGEYEKFNAFTYILIFMQGKYKKIIRCLIYFFLLCIILHLIEYQHLQSDISLLLVSCSLIDYFSCSSL